MDFQSVDSSSAISSDSTSMFDWGSSHVDWCEANYKVTPYIAEFYNTLSNIPFLLLPPIAIYYNLEVYHKYGFKNSLTLIILFIIGAGSFYFHAKLSFAGQILDELAILYVVTFCLAVYVPRDEYPKFIKTRNQWHTSLALVTGISTLTPFIIGPHFSVLVAPVLMSTIIPCVRIIHRERHFHDKNLSAFTKTVVNISYVLLFVGVSAWLVDRVVCPNELIKIELHAVWHLCIYVTGHLCLTYLFLYDIMRYHPNEVTLLHVFPVPHLEMVHPHAVKQQQQLNYSDKKSTVKANVTVNVKSAAKSTAFMKLAHRANGNILRIKGVVGPELGTKTM